MSELSLSPAQKAWVTRRERAAAGLGPVIKPAPTRMGRPKIAAPPAGPVWASPRAMERLVAELRQQYTGPSLETLARMIVADPATIARPARRLPGDDEHNAPAIARPRKPVAAAIAEYVVPARTSAELRRILVPGPTMHAHFADGELVRMSFASLPGRPANVGHGLRVAIEAYRSRRGPQRRFGLTEYSQTLPVPELAAAFVRSDNGVQPVDVAAANAHTKAMRVDDPKRRFLQAWAQTLERTKQLCLPAPTKRARRATRRSASCSSSSTRSGTSSKTTSPERKEQQANSSGSE